MEAGAKYSNFVPNVLRARPEFSLFGALFQIAAKAVPKIH